MVQFQRADRHPGATPLAIAGHVVGVCALWTRGARLHQIRATHARGNEFLYSFHAYVP
jgi:hypothetical protein